MTEKPVTIANLFFTFAKIGSMTFGGGYAMLPIIERELIDKRHWIKTEEIMDFYAISQATPGVIAVNVATLIGFQKRKYLGAIAATLGVVAPSLIIIIAIASFLGLWVESEIVARIFSALRICVAALVINALIPFFKRGIINVLTFILFAFSFTAFYFFKISPVLIIILCAAVYIMYDLIKRRFK
jgi:chromate transporter